MFLIIWDKIFGTFTPETEPVVYGVTKPPANNSLDELILHEFRNMIHDVKLRRTFAPNCFIFGPPGGNPMKPKSLKGLNGGLALNF